MARRIAWAAAEIAVRVIFLRRMWREAMPEDRAVYLFLAGWTGAIFIVGYLLG
jgi:hypothetical protein